MEIKKISEEQSVLPRKDYVFTVSYQQKTPSRQELKNILVNELKSKPELVIVKNIDNHYGSKTSKVIVHVYEKEKDLQVIEEEYLVKKNQPPKKEEKEGDTAE